MKNFLERNNRRLASLNRCLLLLTMSVEKNMNNIDKNVAAQLRCCGCRKSPGKVAPDFRCDVCGDLLEVDYPLWMSQPWSVVDLKNSWLERRKSSHPLD